MIPAANRIAENPAMAVMAASQGVCGKMRLEPVPDDYN